MGLDTSHNAWHGAYSAFMRWRIELAKVAGLPPLHMMKGFWVSGAAGYDPATVITNESQKESVQRFCENLPIKWECLKPDPLYILLAHSDCDGQIAAEDCGPIADRLEKLLPLLPNGDGGGHIGNWRDKTEQFIKGLRRAAAANEPLDFH